MIYNYTKNFVKILDFEAIYIVVLILSLVNNQNLIPAYFNLVTENWISSYNPFSTAVIPMNIKSCSIFSS